MERVMVIGCSGAGKSTFSRKLSQLTALELIHLDQHFWKPNWEEIDKAEWKEIVEMLSSKPKWIIDGNYGGTMDIRLSRADTIIFLDYPTLTCLWRVTKRTLTYRGRERPDMPKGCKERFDLNFYLYVAMYNTTRRKEILDKLAKVKGEKRMLIFNNDREASHFLGELREMKE
ncbi:MAG: DNA topology modulation protein [Bacteroidota bacterium]